MAPQDQEEVPATRIILEFVGPTGRQYIAGGLLGPLITQGEEGYLDPADTEGLGIKLAGIKVVLDD